MSLLAELIWQGWTTVIRALACHDKDLFLWWLACGRWFNRTDISHKLQVSLAFLISLCPCISTTFLTNEKSRCKIFTGIYISGFLQFGAAQSHCICPTDWGKSCKALGSAVASQLQPFSMQRCHKERAPWWLALGVWLLTLSCLNNISAHQGFQGAVPENRERLFSLSW